MTLGHQVGYWTDYASIQSDGSEGKGPETRIVYVTEEVLIAELKRDPKLSKYACIIVDEAHKRTMQTELLLALLKMALVARRDHSLKVKPIHMLCLMLCLQTTSLTLYFRSSSCPPPWMHVFSSGTSTTRHFSRFLV